MLPESVSAWLWLRFNRHVVKQARKKHKDCLKDHVLYGDTFFMPWRTWIVNVSNLLATMARVVLEQNGDNDCVILLLYSSSVKKKLILSYLQFWTHYSSFSINKKCFCARSNQVNYSTTHSQRQLLNSEPHTVLAYYSYYFCHFIIWEK